MPRRQRVVKRVLSPSRRPRARARNWAAVMVAGARGLPLATIRRASRPGASRVFCRRRALAAWWNGADGDQSTKRMAEVVMPARCDAAERPNCGLRAENRGTRPGCRGSGSRPRSRPCPSRTSQPRVCGLSTHVAFNPSTPSGHWGGRRSRRRCACGGCPRRSGPGYHRRRGAIRPRCGTSLSPGRGRRRAAQQRPSQGSPSAPPGSEGEIAPLIEPAGQQALAGSSAPR
jgi:hypothetical protein